MSTVVLVALAVLPAVVLVQVERVVAIEADSSRCVTVPGGRPDDLVVVNVTNTTAAGRGHGVVRASDAIPLHDRRPEDRFSSVNFARGVPVNPNLSVSRIGSDGRICYDGALSSHDVVVDLMGVVPPSSVTVSDPVRLVDTRIASRVAANSSVCTATVPEVTAGDLAVVNITPVRAAGRGFGALRADDGSTPVFERVAPDQFSSVNFAAATPPDPNLGVVELGPDGRFCYDGAVADHDVILDLTAVLRAEALVPTAPRRLLDTRRGSPLAPLAARCVDVEAGSPGDAVFVNITNTGATGRGYGLLRSSAAPPVGTRSADERLSSVNFAAGTPPNPNLALVTIGPDGRVCYDAAGAAHHTILDLFAVVDGRNTVASTPARLLDTRVFSSTCTPFARSTVSSDEVTGPWRRLSDDEFQRIVDLTSDAGIISTPPPAILGDPIADARIRAIAERRGYRQRNDAGLAGMVGVSGGLLNPATAAAWNSLVADAQRAGIGLYLASGYRTVARQRAIFVSKLGSRGHGASSVRAGRADAAIDEILRFSSIPGYSRHHTGAIVDILSPGFTLGSFHRSAAYRWLTADNYLEAKRHGFVPSYPPHAGDQGPEPEPWEFVHVGTDALRATDAFGRVDSMSIEQGPRLDAITVTGKYSDPDQFVELYNDETMVVRALARCLRVEEDLERGAGFRLTAEVAESRDVCVVARGVDGRRRLLGCVRSSA